MYAQELTTRYREIGLRLRPLPPPRPRLAMVKPAEPIRFVMVRTPERWCFPSKQTTAQKIIAALVEISGVDRAKLLSRTRKKDVVEHRHFMQAMLREHTDLSFPVIGRYLGARDHSSIIHAARRGRELIAAGQYWRDLADAVAKAIRHERANYALSDTP